MDLAPSQRDELTVRVYHFDRDIIGAGIAGLPAYHEALKGTARLRSFAPRVVRC